MTTAFPVTPMPRAPAHAPVVVVGAGLVGLTLALDLAQHGVAVLVLSRDTRLADGSRAICFAKRTLEIYDRLGIGAGLRDAGTMWRTGKVFVDTREVYRFDLLPEPGHAFPAFVNLPQTEAERALVIACEANDLVELRWGHAVTGIAQDQGGARLTVRTEARDYTQAAGYVLACDGARSTLARALGLAYRGQSFDDRFLIADIVMAADFPAERRFWFDPPFHRGSSVLLHRQPNNLWRIDFHLGPNADAEAERDPARVRARVAAMLGPEIAFSIDWVSVYTFRCRRLDRFVHGRVIFAGDAAHQVSPFGARGGNGGVQDADNLGWKLAAVLAGTAGPHLLESYNAERIAAADENILHSTRSTDFIAPPGAALALRDGVLDLAATHPFARAMVNSGRLSRPAVLAGSSLNTGDGDLSAAGPQPGTVASDAPLLDGETPCWLLERLPRGVFSLLIFADPAAMVLPRDAPAALFITSTPRPGALHDIEGLAARRYDAATYGIYLLRPDRHVAAYWAADTPDLGQAIAAARTRALGSRPAVKLPDNLSCGDPDTLFAALAEALGPLDPGPAQRLMARLVLLLAEALGDPARVLAAIVQARDPDAQVS